MVNDKNHRVGMYSHGGRLLASISCACSAPATPAHNSAPCNVRRFDEVDVDVARSESDVRCSGAASQMKRHEGPLFLRTITPTLATISEIYISSEYLLSNSTHSAEKLIKDRTFQPLHQTYVLSSYRVCSISCT